MTNKLAVKQLNRIYAYLSSDCKQAIDMAIDALENQVPPEKALTDINKLINENSEKGNPVFYTLIACREALEKQIQKKPDFIFTINIKALDEPIKTDMWKCPNCGLTYNTKEHHCFCGQAIDWSDEL